MRAWGCLRWSAITSFCSLNHHHCWLPSETTDGRPRFCGNTRMIDIAMFWLIIDALRRESRRCSVAFTSSSDPASSCTWHYRNHETRWDGPICFFLSLIWIPQRQKYRDCRVPRLTSLKNNLLYVWNPHGTPSCPEQTAVTVWLTSSRIDRKEAKNNIFTIQRNAF